jgi:bifunctional non-homologous end joining protein LigD
MSSILDILSPTNPQEVSVSLYSQHGGSDKVYNVFLKKGGDGDEWLVNFSNGKRGKTMTPGTKTASPVPYAKALKAFISLVNSKKNGDSHYVEGDLSAVDYQAVIAQDANGAKPLFGIFPQHPTPINAEQMERLLKDRNWGLQQKANGENRLVRSNNGAFDGGNKKGQMCPLPMQWTQEFANLGNFVANGEHVAGDKFMAFDLLEKDGVDLRSRPQKERYEMLEALLAGKETLAPSFKILTCYYEEADKRALLAHVKEHRLEGVVTKLASAPYGEGKGPDSLKYVLNETATCIVTGHNQQQSIQVGLLNDKGEIEPCGNVTCGKVKPAIDSHVDVQYMYRNKSGAFYIPVLDPEGRGHRADVDRSECNTVQVTRFEPESDEIDHDMLGQGNDDAPKKKGMRP